MKVPALGTAGAGRDFEDGLKGHLTSYLATGETAFI